MDLRLMVSSSSGQISPTEIRGALGSINQLFICIGILAALLAGLRLEGNPMWYVVLSWFISCHIFISSQVKFQLEGLHVFHCEFVGTNVKVSE
jgi:hypothetical protein